MNGLNKTSESYPQLTNDINNANTKNIKDRQKNASISEKSDAGKITETNTQKIDVMREETKRIDITAGYSLKSKAGGYIGKFIGINVSNIVLNTAFIFIVLIILIILEIIMHFHWACDYSAKNSDIELIKLLIPLLMTVLGYLFGRGNTKEDKNDDK